MMKKKVWVCILLSVLFLPAGSRLSAQTEERMEWIRSLSDRYWDDGMHIPPREEGSDSILYANHGRTYYYNLDSLCHLIATRQTREISRELWYFYFIVDICGPARRVTDREKIVAAIDRYKSEALRRELDVFDLYMYFRPPVTEEIWDKAWAVMDKYERKGDLQTKLRLMQRVLYFCSGFPTDLVTERIDKDRLPVIRLFNEILSTADRLGQDYFWFEPGYFYRHIGLIYYNFKFYDKAIPLLWKALEQPLGHYYNRNIMIARDYLGSYYRDAGDYARSDSLYLAMLESRENVLFRNTYEAVAIGGLAANARLRQENDKARELYTLALERARRVEDFALAGGFAVRLGRLFLEKEETDKTRALIRQAQQYLTAGGLPLRNWGIYYTLSRDYYLKTNQADIAAHYIDSISQVEAEQERLYSARLLSYAEQENYEEENERKEKQLGEQKARIRLISWILLLTFLSLAVVFFLYHRQRKRNYALFLKIVEQDNATPPLEVPSEEDTAAGSTTNDSSQMIRQRKLFLALRDYLLRDRNFARAEIDVQKLVTELSTNRSYLFEAIKSLTGKTLQEYINDLRLEEARKLLENTEDPIEEVALMCGYNTVRTFYRLFQSHYNISPAAYRRMYREREKTRE